MEFLCKVQRINCKLRKQLHACGISTTAYMWRKKPWVRKGPFNTFEGYRSHIPLDPNSKEIRQAQAERVPFDYPLGEDQKATWRHSRWYDHYINKWVKDLPYAPKNEFWVDKKNMRMLIHEQENTTKKFHLLLDKAIRRKYIIEPFDIEFPENISYYYQYLTNTKFVHGLPYSIDSMKVDEKSVEQFEEFLTNMLRLEFHCKSESRKQRADKILKNIAHYLMDSASSSDDFYDCEVDYDPENSMFWHRGRGFHKWTMPDDLPVYMQSHDTPVCQIRTRKTLSEFTPWMDEFMLTGDIPTMEFTPHVYDIRRMQYRNTITPGIRFKAGDVAYNYQDALETKKLHELPPPLLNDRIYGHTQFISLPEEFDPAWYQHNLFHCDISDQMEEHLKAHGIMSGWTWSAAQAHYDGHWMDDDIQSPVCIQSIITDGEYMSFFCYQLNTVAIDPENADSNPRRNICYGTPFMKLYNKVEETDEIELYRDAVTLLLKFISNGSHIRVDREMAIQHNKTLEVQEWDPEKPIEDQRPKHIREQEAALEEARKVELVRNKGVKDKLLDLILK